jgi:prevent-host-death family protein
VAAKRNPVNISEAKTHFSKLLKRVLKGEEVIIPRAGQPIARLSPLQPKRRGKRVPGSAEGMFTMSDHFDALLPEDLQRAFEE